MSIRQYTMQWADLRDRRCVMDIINTEVADGETATLTPSGTPFVTQTDGDTNPMTPIRAQSGKIGFIATDGFRILPRNSHQWRIVMRREGRTMWTGWLKAETYNQRLWGVNEEVTLNVIDDVEALKTWTLDADAGFGMVTLRSLIVECLSHIHSVTGGDALEMEWSMDVMPTSGSFHELFNLQVSRYNYFSRVADSDSHEGKSCYEVMESICKVFGWTMSLQPATYGHEGMKMLFSYAGASNYMKDTFQNFSDATWAGGTDSVPQVEAMEKYQSCNLHDYSIEPGYRKLSVVSKINKASNTLPSLQFDDADIKWVEEFDVLYLRNTVLQEPMPWKARLLQPRSNLVSFPRYENPRNEEYILFTGEITEENFGSLSGISLLSQDYWHGPEEDPGTVEQKNSEGEVEPKRNYTWSTLMMVTDNHVDPARPVMIAKSADSCVFKNGGFDINMDVHCQQFPRGLVQGSNITGQSFPSPLKYGSALNEESKTYMHCKLRVGNMFWDGSAWTPSETVFKILISPQKNNSYGQTVTNKLLTMPFTASHHAVPITNTLVGNIEFQLIGVQVEKEDGSDTLDVSRALIQNLTFNYCEPENERTLDDLPDSHEYTHTEEGWTETMVAVTLDIHSDKSDPANYGVLTYANGSTLKTVYNALAETSQRPEEALLEKYKSHFTRSREILTLRYFLQDWMEPRNEASIGNETYNLLAVQSVDWQTGEAELVLEHQGIKSDEPEAPEANNLAYTLAMTLGG